MAAPATPTHGPQSGQGQSHALTTIDDAFRTFQASVSKDHARDFHSTTLKDVWSAARQVENKLAAEQSSRNLRRIQPFLEGLDHYSKAIEVLCNGTPYLPWVWAPIKLCLIISSDFISAFEKLIKAYGQIAEALPRFDRLSHALKAKPEFQAVLALVYCDIVEFHRRAYKIFTDSAWKRFFDTSWKRFDLHFAAVLESLRQHTDLVDREANAYGIASTLEAIVMIDETRSKIHDAATAAANARRDTEFEAVMAWFDVQDYLHEDHFTALEAKSIDGTCEWFFKHRIVERWIDAAPLNPKDSKLWVFGKPGSGKSVLCVNLVKHLRAAGTYSTAYHLFSYQAGSRNNPSAFLRGIACQLLRQRPDSTAFIYDNYIRKGQSPSIHALKGLLVDLIASMPQTRIAIDGLDECTESEQKEILKLALSLGEDAASLGRCKVAIFSRDVPIIGKSLARYPLLSLTEESSAVNRSIAAFVRLRITQIRAEQDDLPGSDREYLQLEQKITNKADGMFLWAYLILCSLEDACSLRQLQTVVEELPPGLENAYARITDRLRARLPSEISQRTVAIFNWIAFAERPLLEGELLDAVALSSQPYVLNNSTKLARRVLDYGKPLIDVARNGTVQFVHFTVKEFLLDDRSGPFLSTRQAYKEISIACTAYVLQALDLVDPMIDDEVHLRGFRDVLYAFHAYSWNNWLVHLKSYASLCNEAGAEAIHNVDLSKRIDAILQRHNALLVTYNKPCPQQTMDGQQLQPVTALCNSKDFPYLLDAFDEDILNETVDSRLPEAHVGPMPVERTLFRYVNRRYNMFADKLHATDLSVEPTGDSVSSRPALYHCSIVNCARKSTGFTTAGDRDKHEREHTPRIRCSEPSCQFASAIGFRSAKDLRRHMNAHHSPSRKRLPIFRIHSEQLSDTVSHTPAASSAPLGPLVPSAYTSNQTAQTPRLSRDVAEPDTPLHRMTPSTFLNDSLRYLDFVDSQFEDQPGVYAKFLDIMESLKSGTIDTPGVIDSVYTLFEGHRDLVLGLNQFLPPGYNVDCDTIDNFEVLRVTTPSGGRTLYNSAVYPFPLITTEGPPNSPGSDKLAHPTPGLTFSIQDGPKMSCICDSTHDDDLVVACDSCEKEQHAICYYPDAYRHTFLKVLPHYCIQCKPRDDIDIDLARQRQRTRQRLNHLATDHTELQSPRRPGASSYWSVPEQTDFLRYIAHFGTDFRAIASHMGTKTQTMVKNHYQRQVDGGRDDLLDAARKADARRQRGEDISATPTPTPITKRPYDIQQPSTSELNADEHFSL